jgi:nicotinate-nucleotide adenylyltransferase
MKNIPIGIIARPGDRVAARTSKAAKIFAHARLPARASNRLGRSRASSGSSCSQWCFINVPMTSASSTKIRNAGAWK